MKNDIRNRPTWRASVLHLFALLCIASALVGCGKFIKVSGRVTYADGTPLTRGQILFSDGYYMGRSDLNENGEYQLHIFRKNDGIPPGIYNVYIVSAIQFEEIKTKREVSARAIGEVAKMHLLIDQQYTTPAPSGWVVEVNKKNRKFDFTVYPPGKVPEEEQTEESRFQFDPEYRARKVKEYWQEKAKEEEEERKQGKYFESEHIAPYVNSNLL